MSSGKTTRRKRKSNVALDKHDCVSRKAKKHNGQNEPRTNQKLNNYRNKRFHDDKTPIYWCLECTFASISYDLMIEHCQRHIIDETPVDVGIRSITLIPAEVMGKNVEVDSDTNEKYDDSNKDSYIFAQCDYELLKRNEWPGIMKDTLNECKIDKIQRESIYYYTRIIRFTSDKKASSAPYMLFKCMKCMKYIDPRSVEQHVQENSCNKLLEGFSCYKCKIPFPTENSMYFHYRTCVANQANGSMKYTTISFNYDHDKQINALLLKAAGLNMQCESSGNNNSVHQPPGIEELQSGVSTTVQQTSGIEEPQGGLNNTLQQSSDTVQSQVVVKKWQDGVKTWQSVQQSPGIEEPKGGINDNAHQTPSIEEPLGGITNTVHQTPGIEEPQGDINNTVHQTSGIEETQGRVNNSAQQALGIEQSQNRINNTETPGIEERQGGVNNTAQHTPGIEEPQDGLNNTLQQSPGIVQPQVGVKQWQMMKDTRIIIQGKNKTKESSEIAVNVVNDKVATVYKCQCELCFHALYPLFKHFKSCTSDLILKKNTCSLCSLVFDEQQDKLHCSLHTKGITKLNVKKVTVCDEKVIPLNMQHEIKENSGPKEKNTNKDIATGKTNDIAAKASKKDQVKDRKPIAQLTKTILNLSSMVTRGTDPKNFVNKQQQTTATSTWAVDPKSDNSTDKSVYMAATQTVHEVNKEIGNAIQDKPGETNSISQIENNIELSEAVSTNQLTTDASNGNLHTQNNTKEDQSMVETIIEVEFKAKNNTCMTKHEENNQILNLAEIQGTPNVNNNQEAEVINEQSKKNNECEESMEETENENVVKDVECNIGQKANANKPEVIEVAAKSKFYTEDELLNEDTSMYFDADPSLSDDEDPILNDIDD